MKVIYLYINIIITYIFFLINLNKNYSKIKYLTHFTNKYMIFNIKYTLFNT